MREECGKDYYQNIVALANQDTTSKDAIQIDKDIHRWESVCGLFCRTSLKGKKELSEKEISDLREVLKAVSYELRRICQCSVFMGSGGRLLPIDELHCCIAVVLHGQRTRILHAGVH